MSKKLTFMNSQIYRCIYCDHRGNWITVYVRSENFISAVEHIRDKADMYVIKEVSEKLENGEAANVKIEEAITIQ